MADTRECTLLDAVWPWSNVLVCNIDYLLLSHEAIHANHHRATKLLRTLSANKRMMVRFPCSSFPTHTKAQDTRSQALVR